MEGGIKLRFYTAEWLVPAGGFCKYRNSTAVMSALSCSNAELFSSELAGKPIGSVPEVGAQIRDVPDAVPASPIQAQSNSIDRTPIFGSMWVNNYNKP